MISYLILENEGIVIIEPISPLKPSDFGMLNKDIDNYINQKGIIKGIIIHTESFPRWDNISAFIKDLKFVRDHQQKTKRVASVTNSKLLKIVHKIAHHFLSPEIKHFAYGDIETAKKWIQEAI